MSSSNICRLCLRNEDHINKQNIFDLLMCDTLFWTFGVEVDVGDSFSKLICQKCLKLINHVMKWKNFFQMNQYFLKEQKCPVDFNIELVELTFDVGTQTNYREDMVTLNLDTLAILNNPVVEAEKLEQSRINKTFKKIGNHTYKNQEQRGGHPQVIINEVLEESESENFQKCISVVSKTVIKLEDRDGVKTVAVEEKQVNSDHINTQGNIEKLINDAGIYSLLISKQKTRKRHLKTIDDVNVHKTKDYLKEIEETRTNVDLSDKVQDVIWFTEVITTPDGSEGEDIVDFEEDATVQVSDIIPQEQNQSENVALETTNRSEVLIEDIGIESRADHKEKDIVDEIQTENRKQCIDSTQHDSKDEVDHILEPCEEKTDDNVVILSVNDIFQAESTVQRKNCAVKKKKRILSTRPRGLKQYSHPQGIWKMQNIMIRDQIRSKHKGLSRSRITKSFQKKKRKSTGIVTCESDTAVNKECVPEQPVDSNTNECVNGAVNRIHSSVERIHSSVESECSDSILGYNIRPLYVPLMKLKQLEIERHTKASSGADVNQREKPKTDGSNIKTIMIKERKRSLKTQDQAITKKELSVLAEKEVSNNIIVVVVDDDEEIDEETVRKEVAEQPTSHASINVPDVLWFPEAIPKFDNNIDYVHDHSYFTHSIEIGGMKREIRTWNKIQSTLFDYIAAGTSEMEEHYRAITSRLNSTN